MAKKKTIEAENIKAAPVLRASSGGDQPTPTPTEQTGTRTYQIMDPWKERDVVNLVDVKSADGEITDVKINGEPAGGGGDVTIITVNISNNTSQTKQLALPYIDENSADVGPIISLLTLSAYSGDVYKIPIYRGSQKFNVGTGWTLDITGDAERTSTTVVEIWGDAEITIS